MDKKIISPNSFLSDILPLSPKIEMKDGWSCPNPFDSDWIWIEDPDLGYANMEFAAPTPPSISKVETYASNESSMSDYCRFAQVVLSLPPIEGVDFDFDLGIEHDNSSPSNGARY